MIHKIVVDPVDFHNIKRYFKFCIIKKNDRPYRIGDTIIFREFNEFGFTGGEVKREVTYIETKVEGLQEGYIILSFISENRKNKSHKYVPKMKKSTEELMNE